MDWDAIGAIADLASALAVALSLVYLAVQVREFRRQAEIDLSMRLLENADRARTEVWTNAEVAAFLERCLSAPDPLPTIDLILVSVDDCASRPICSSATSLRSGGLARRGCSRRATAPTPGTSRATRSRTSG